EKLKVGYARVSSEKQNLERQILDLKEFGVEKIFTEKQSGKNIIERPIFQEMMEFLREGDILVVNALDRLGRNYNEVKTTVDLLKYKNVKFVSTSLPMMNEYIGNELLDGFFKDLIIQTLAMVSEQERNISKKRQAEGIAVAKTKGVYKGRPILYGPNAKDPHKRFIYETVISMLERNESVSEIARNNNISRLTVYRIKKDYQRRDSNE